MNKIALDIGNVICYVKLENFSKYLAKSINISDEDAMYFLNRTQKSHDLGLTTIKDELKDHFKIKSSLTVESLVHSWNDIIHPSYIVCDKLDELASKGYEIALLSNIGIDHANIINQTMGNTFVKNAIKHFSCDVGARKPTLLYYQSFLAQYPEFKGCLYVDDLQENLNASKKFGFKTFRFSLEDHNPEDLSNKMQEIESLI